MNSLTNNEKVHAFTELYKTQLDRYDKRRDYEWKVTIGLWTGVAILTGFLVGKIQFSAYHFWLYLAVWSLFSFLWTPGSWVANARDLEYALTYLNRVELLLGHATDKREFNEPKWWGFLTNWSRTSQVIGTGFIMYMSWYLLKTIPVK